MSCSYYSNRLNPNYHLLLEPMFGVTLTILNIICSHEATSSRKIRILAKELTGGAVAFVFLVCIFLYISLISFMHIFSPTKLTIPKDLYYSFLHCLYYSKSTLGNIFMHYSKFPNCLIFLVMIFY